MKTKPEYEPLTPDEQTRKKHGDQSAYLLVAAFMLGAAIGIVYTDTLAAGVVLVGGIIFGILGIPSLQRWNQSRPKPKKRISKDVTAVSPVIAVILMVAITVVLAATVFVLVNDIGNKGGQTAPSISFTVDDGADRFSVSSSAATADWDRIAVRLDSVGTSNAEVRLGSGSLVVGYQNTAASGTTGAALSTTAPQEVTSTKATIQAGDFLEFCGNVSGAPGTVVNVKLTVIDSTASQTLGSFMLSSISPC